MAIQPPFRPTPVPMISRVIPVREDFWIYTIVLFVLGSVYGWALYTLPDLHTPTRLVVFTGLMALHASLHILGPRPEPRRRWLPPYFIVQGALAFIIIRMTAGSQSPFALYLYLALAAQAIGLLITKPLLAFLPVAAYLILGVVNFVWGWGWSALPAFLWAAVPQTIVIIAFVMMFIWQANARRHAQQLFLELEIAHHQLADYAVQVKDLTLVAERQRMARELHDTLAQGLAGLILQLEAIDMQLARGRLERVKAIVEQAMERARSSLAGARRSIDDLRAAESPVTDLAEAIRLEAKRFTRDSGIPCTLQLESPAYIPTVVHENAVRIVAEGLTNVARHAHAAHVRIEMGGEDALEITLADDGVGFDTETISGRDGHYGLVGLRERAHLLNGTVNVISVPGQGTILSIHVPIVEGAHD
jgi:two-component system, NarL family, sensor histidine kinase YdfH